MFRKIVSNLPFSSALVGQLSFYAKRLRKEELTRRAGLIFTALAIAVQSLAVFVPPEATNAETPGKVGGAPRCDAQSVGPRGQAFKVDGTVATVTFDVSGGPNCKVQLSSNSFYAPTMDGRPYSQQILFQRVTKIYDTPGRYTMQVNLPPQSTPAKGCYYQVDLTYGTHNVLPVIAYGHGTLNCDQSTPTAVCSSLAIANLSDTKFSLTGTATVNKASISKYTFDITQPDGKVVQKVVTTTNTTASAEYESSLAGTYKVVLTVQTSLGAKTGADCTKTFTVQPPAAPTADCKAISAAVINRTQLYLSGSSQTAGGATIKSYTFVIKNANGTEIKRQVVQSTSLSAATSAIELTTPGNYSAQLIVQTSVGDKTNTTSCVTNFAISPPSVCQYNPLLPPSHPDCQPCPGDETIWIKNEKCHPDIVQTKEGLNLTQGKVDATKVIAKASDKLTFTLTAQNKGTASTSTTISEDLSDVLEYAELIDNGGGKFDPQTKTLSWPAVTLAPKEKTARVIAIQVRNPIPVTNTGTTNKESYNCEMVNVFGNKLTVAVSCPVEKRVVEQLVAELPHTGPRENMIFAGVLGAVVVYFWARSRQLGKEVRLIRRDVHAGAI